MQLLLDVTRRRFLAVTTAAGLGQTMFPGALLALAGQTATIETDAPKTGDATLPKIAAEMIDKAAIIAGIRISEDQKAMMLDALNGQRDDVLEIRKLPLPNSVAPAFVFDPLPGGVVIETTRLPLKMGPTPDLTALSAGLSAGNPEHSAEALAFCSVRELAELLRTRQVTSTTLTRMYLARLKRFDPKLHFVITLTEERALRQASEADAEIAAGHYRGPLHGIPWGAKDLLAVKGYPTTWGAAGYEQQTFNEDAEVVRRLDAAGAVLIAKLSLGALAQGDLWGSPEGSDKPGGRTRNPWNPRQGSSGSSAGSASAVSAGCVGFALGSETLGSISSPCTRCGVTGLRPTFGLVPRTGAMALSWTMDKIGPICRSVEDCAVVLSAIYGPDGRDLAVKPAAFNWDASFDWRTLRIGFLKSAFGAPTMPELKAPTSGIDTEMDEFRKRQARMQAAMVRATYDAKYDNAALAQIRKMGFVLIPVELPKLPYGAMVPPLEAEAAAAFDALTRSGRDKLLSGQQPFDWPNNFRVARFYSAVDYIQAMRGRTLAIKAMEEMFEMVDIIVAPSHGEQLTATNLTGHPAIIVPNGLRGPDAPPPANDVDGAVDNSGGPGTPVSLTFLGGLYADARLAAFARAYQEASGFSPLHPHLV